MRDPVSRNNAHSVWAMTRLISGVPRAHAHKLPLQPPHTKIDSETGLLRKLTYYSMRGKACTPLGVQKGKRYEIEKNQRGEREETVGVTSVVKNHRGTVRQKNQ